MQVPLILAGLAMGVAASPHCAAMCGAPCASLTQGCKRSATGFHLGRLVGYMAGGAAAAGSVALLGVWSERMGALRPVWMLLHLMFLALGLYWLSTGRQVSAMTRDGAVPVSFTPRRGKPLRAGLAGLAWIAWPCGALQAALLLAALANTPQAGALVMAAFAIGSMPALAAAPWAWARWASIRGAAPAPAWVASTGLRVAGAALVLSSGWAMLHGVWPQVSAWCGL